MKFRVVGCIVISCASQVASANALDGLIGYTIIAKKTIVGSIEKDGTKKDAFEGCDYDRVIVFDDGTGVICKQYNYMYAYRPDAFVANNGSTIKLMVENETMIVGRIP